MEKKEFVTFENGVVLINLPMIVDELGVKLEDCRLDRLSNGKLVIIPTKPLSEIIGGKAK